MAGKRILALAEGRVDDYEVTVGPADEPSGRLWGISISLRVTLIVLAPAGH